MQAQWTLQTYLKLPWRPYIDVIGATEYILNEDANQVCYAVCALVLRSMFCSSLAQQL